MSGNNAQAGGVGFAGALTIAFVVLKLCGVIAWSWWWVTSPVWISIGLVLALLVLLALAAFGSVWWESLPAKRSRGDAHRSPFGPVRRWGYRPADVERPGAAEVPGINAGASLVPWWCDEHQQHRYDGPNACDRLHQEDPEEMCGYHLRAHGPYEFGPLCRAWDGAALEGSPRRRYLRWLHR